MSDDPVLDEVRRVRREISQEHGNDTRRLVEHYLEYQKQFRDRLRPPPEGARDQETSEESDEAA